MQEAFWEEGGFECGFCTPGMILAARALLDENLHPSEEDIKHALDGNTCRCTGYLSIIRSVKRAAALLRGQDTGASRPTEDRRLDGVAKVRGEPVYTADLTHPAMLYGRILRSPHAHARIPRHRHGRGRIPSRRCHGAHRRRPEGHLARTTARW